MTGRGHRVVTFMLVGAATRSPLAAACAMLGSVFPDTLERPLFGRARNRWHRKLTHWFVPWVAMALFCFHRAGGLLPCAALLDGSGAAALWSCASLWLTGCALHIAEDACCGKTPFLLPWRRDFGVHLFRMSSRAGRMSAGERYFVIAVSLSCLAVWLARGAAL